MSAHSKLNDDATGTGHNLDQVLYFEAQEQILEICKQKSQQFAEYGLTPDDVLNEIRSILDRSNDELLDDDSSINANEQIQPDVYCRTYLNYPGRNLVIEYIDGYTNEKENEYVDAWRLIDIGTGEIFCEDTLPHEVIAAASEMQAAYFDSKCHDNYVESTKTK
jgi:hypothetical protein